jgi:hypothetical protein
MSSIWKSRSLSRIRGLGMLDAVEEGGCSANVGACALPDDPLTLLMLAVLMVPDIGEKPECSVPAG